MIEAWHAKEKHYLFNRGYGFVAAGYFEVTPLKSTTKPVKFVNLGADVTKRQNKFLKKNARTQKRMALDDIPCQPAEAALKKMCLNR